MFICLWVYYVTKGDSNSTVDSSIKEEQIIGKVVEIHENGRIKRQESEKELEALEKELKEKLLEINLKK